MSGALAGAASEYVAQTVYENGVSANNAIIAGQVTGAATSLLTSSLSGNSDEQVAKDIQLGGIIGANAAANNAVNDGIGVSSLDEDKQLYDESKDQLDGKIKSVKTDLQTDLADTVANSDSNIVKGVAFTGLTATNILFPESIDEIMLGVIGGGLGAGSRAEMSAINKIDFPPNMGFAEGPYSASLITGATVDRYGSSAGRFVSPAGYSFEGRSLPKSYANQPLNTYQVTKPINIEAGNSLPWYGQKGNELQFRLPSSVENLINEGYLKQINK